MYTLGETIAALRKKKGLTQEALASVIGVSPQSISKWETGSNMPDIALLPVLADIFGVTIDHLFGRKREEEKRTPDQALDACCHQLLQTVGACLYRDDSDQSFEVFIEKFKKALASDDRQRTAILRRHGVVYYRHALGGLLLKRPQSGWSSLLRGDVDSLLELLSSADFRTALTEIIQSGQTTFTLPSLSSRCPIRSPQDLENRLLSSGLFVSKTIDTGDASIVVFELVQSQRLWLLFAVFALLAEYRDYQDIFTGYFGDIGYYLDEGHQYD